MKNLSLLLLAFCISACTNNSDIESSSGTRLVSIEISEFDKTWVEEYTYSANSELIQIEEIRPLAKTYTIEYENNKLKAYSTFTKDNDQLIFRDSILYNNNGTIMAIHKFSRSSEGNLTLDIIYEFEYDDENKLTTQSFYRPNSQNHFRIKRYYWAGDNIEKVEHLNAEEELYYEYFYKYDDKENYNKELPKGISDPINWCKNNVVEMDWIDYVGDLDLICKPCSSEYRYNLDDYPISIKHNWGSEMELRYE